MRAFVAAALALSVFAGCSSSNTVSNVPNVAPTAAPAATQLSAFQSKINHIIVISQENWSFDSLYGFFPGANGYGSLVNGVPQVDANGNAIAVLPQPLLSGQPDSRFPATLPVAPFNLANYIDSSASVPTGTAITADPNHNFYLQQYEIDGGRMDRYLAPPASAGTQAGLPFGYYDVTNLPEGKIVQQYALLDNFRQATFGGSFINNTWLVCACVLPFPNAPASIVEQNDANGNPIIGGPEGRVTPDGFAVNTIFPTQYAVQAQVGTSPTVPTSTQPTIGDRLSAANVSWGFYSGGWNQYLAGTKGSLFQSHHQSFTYFKGYGPTDLGTAHIRDDSNLINDIASGNLPAVTFVKPYGANNEHPGYTNLITGQGYISNLISAIQMSPIWKDSMILVYYDEAGGHYDHVPPTPVDRWGPSTRVPAYVVSPFAKRGFVDHSAYEVTSILSTIEARFGLQPLASRDATAPTLLGMFDFTQATPKAFARMNTANFPVLPASAGAPVAPGSHGGHTELDD